MTATLPLRPPVAVPKSIVVRSRWLGWAALGLMLLAFGIRLFRLGDASYWGDELVSVVYGQLPPIEIPGWAAENDPHPPLYYLLLHGWMLLSGTSEFATRLFSVLLGVLAVPLIGAVGRRLAGRGVALAAMLFLAVNPLHIQQSRDARMYALLVVLTLASLWLLTRLNDRRSWIAYVVVSAASLYTHYYAGFSLLAHAAYVLPRRDLAFTRRWLVAAVAISVLFLPWLIPGLAVIVQYEGYGNAGGYEAGGPLPVALRAVLDAFSFGPWLPADPLRAIAEVAIAGLLVAGSVLAWRRGRLLVLALFVPVLAVYLASFARPVFLPRYLIAASPALLLLLGWAVVWALRRRWAPLGGAALAGLVGIQAAGALALATSPALANADWRAAARFVTARELPTDGIIYGHDGIKWLFGYYHTTVLDEYLPPFGTAGREAEIDAQLRRFTADHDRVWFVPWWQSETDVYIERWLNANAYKAINRWVGPIRLTMYASPSALPPAAASGVVYGDSLRLTSWAADRTQAAPGDIVRLALNWQAVDDIDENLKVLIKLVDDRGRAFATIDRLPRDGPTIGWSEGERVVDRYGLTIPPGTPAGTYSLDVDLYRQDSGERLVPAVDSAGQRLRIGTLRVVPASRPFPAEAVEADTPSTATIAGARLAGYSIDLGARRPGDLVSVTLYWLPSGTRSSAIRLVLGDPDRPVASVDVSPDGTAGSVVRQDVTMRIRPGSRIERTGLWLRTDREAVQLGAIDIVAPPALPDPPAPNRRLDARFADLAVLEGMTIRPDGISLVWRAEREIETPYAVFVHALDRDGRIVAQSDGMPARGAAPTTAWLPRQRVGDDHQIRLADAVSVRIGLYDPETLQRVPAGDGDSVVVPIR